MSITVALVIMLLALAAFAVITVRRGSLHDHREAERQAHDQLLGFVYVGSGAAVALAVIVITVSLIWPARWWIDIVAVLGFFGYCLYLLVAFVLHQYATSPRTEEATPRHARGYDDILE